MADFQARLTASRFNWIDDAVPSRINPLPGRPHRYYLVGVGDTVTVRCQIGSTEAPLDAALGGRLFYPKWTLYPAEGMAPPPSVTVTPGQSSVMTFIPNYAGHYLLTIIRQDGAGFSIPFVAEDF